MKHRLLNIALAIGIAATLSCAYLLDGPDDHSAERAQAEVMELQQKADEVEARMERAARQLCVKLKGPNAGHRWDENNRLVCIDNRGRTRVVGSI